MEAPNHRPAQFLLLDGCGSKPMPTMISVGQFTNCIRRNPPISGHPACSLDPHPF